MDNPHLEPLLQKLRPFQREAYDFATKGSVYSRQWARDVGASSSARKGNKRKREAKDQPINDSDNDDDNFEFDDQYLGKGRILLADEMGLGKTVTSLAIMTHYYEEWPLLILCPASLRHTWPAEIEKFLPTLPPNAIYVVQGFDDADFFVNRHKRERIRVVVATYSLLQNRSAAAKVLQQFRFRCVIADESHNLKEKSSQRCQLAMPLLKESNRLVLLSGTPALARPVELWAQVHCIAPKLFGAYTPYTKTFCNARRGRFGWDVSGMSNADQLHQKLRQIMVRRLKANVLTELPPKQRSIVPVPIDAQHAKDCRELLQQIKDTRLSVADLVGQDARSADFEARRLLMMAYQQSGIGKASNVAAFLLDWLNGSGTQKILVFAHHQDVLDTLEQAVAKKYKGVGHIRIDGSVNSKERAVRVKKFQTNSRTRVALLSMTAAGVGLTLTAASSVLFAELHWTPGVLAQAEDRCHRIGQQNAVNVMYCVCKDPELSVDNTLWAMIARKVGNLGRVIDGQAGATMNATIKEDGNNRPAAESGEDELTRFFAEASSKNESARKAPAKGSILSFFRTPAKDKDANPKATSPQPGAHKAKKSVTPPSGSKVKWSCEVCTFDNERERATSTGWLACTMCATPFMASQEPLTIMDLTQTTTDSSARAPEGAIVIDDSDESTTSCRTATQSPLAELLKFSVSQNSGRVYLHEARQGSSLHVNFDVTQILTEESANELDQSQVTRTSSNQSLAVNFVDAKVRKVLLQTSLSGLQHSRTLGQGCTEIKKFVSSFLALREIEKKRLKESGLVFSSRDLRRQIAAQTVDERESGTTTDRYGGGAKEQALERQNAGTATSADLAVLEGKACAWCGGRIAQAGSTYCSQSCAEDGRLRRGGMYASSRVREQVFGLEGGVCRKCKIDAHALYTRIVSLQPPERLNALCNVNWNLPKSSVALERLLQNPKESDFWQADHIVAVAEGGGSCGLENLQTLCTPCHREETNKLRSRLRLGSKVVGEKRKQMDIRAALGMTSKRPKP